MPGQLCDLAFQYISRLKLRHLRLEAQDHRNGLKADLLCDWIGSLAAEVAVPLPAPRHDPTLLVRFTHHSSISAGEQLGLFILARLLRMRVRRSLSSMKSSILLARYRRVPSLIRITGRYGCLREERAKEKRPGIEVIAMTNNESVRFAVDALKAGAYDVIAKPFGLADVKRLLQNLEEHLKEKIENRIECEKKRSSQGFGNIVGCSPKMETLYRMIGKAARTRHPVLITGESGTGKEMIARALHYSGACREKPFIPVDCGSLVPTLIEK